MARFVTLLDLKTRARTLSNTQNDPNVTDVELVSLANRHLVKVYDALVDAGPPDYYSSTTTLTTQAGISPYVLNVDFRNLSGVYVRNTPTGRRRQIRAMPNGALASYVPPTASGFTVEIEYVPVCPTLVNDSDTFDGVSGFEELVACLMARDIMVKRQDDPSIILGSIQDEKERIVTRGRSRDRGSPKRITDLDDDVNRRDPWFAGGSSGGYLACYRLRASVIELYEAGTYYP